MYLAGHWYLLSPVESAGNSGYKASSDAGNGLLTGTGSDPVEQLDVTRLQERILGPVLGIDDPRTDERLRFSGGTASSVTLAGEVDAGKASVLFTLFPTDRKSTRLNSSH